jgi:hypothetical protein
MVLLLTRSWRLRAKGFSLSDLCKITSLLPIDEVFGQAPKRPLCGSPEEGVTTKPTTKASWSMTSNPHGASRRPAMAGTKGRLALLDARERRYHAAHSRTGNDVRTLPEILLPEK